MSVASSPSGGQLDAEHASKKSFPVSLEDQANCCSHLVFYWVGEIMQLANTTVTRPDGTQGYKRLGDDDMFPVTEDDQPAKVSKLFEKSFTDAKNAKNDHPVQSAIREIMGTRFIYAGFLKLMNSTLQFLPPIFLNFLLESIEAYSGDSDEDVEEWYGYVWVGAILLALSLKTLAENRYFHEMVRVGYRVRTGLTAAIYRKALRLSPAARQGTSVGKIVNLMQVDAEKLDTVMLQIHVIWDGIYQMLGYIGLLVFYIGWGPAMVGLGVCIVLVPINMCFFIGMMIIRARVSKLRDSRVKLTNESIASIKAIKYYNWEKSFMSMVSEARKKELKDIEAAAKLGVGAWVLLATAPAIIAVFTLITYASVSDTFRSSTVFTAVNILLLLRFPLMFYPRVLSEVSSATDSLNRVELFMQGLEIDDYLAIDNGASGSKKNKSGTSDGPAKKGASSGAGGDGDALGIRVNDGTFYWHDPARQLKPIVEVKKSKKKNKAAGKKSKKDKGTAAGGASDSAAVPAEGSKPRADSTAENTPNLGPMPAPTSADAAVAATAAGGAPGGVPPPIKINRARLASDASGGAPTPTPVALAGASDAQKAQAAAQKAVAASASVPPVLGGINLEIPKGELWAVIGPVGSGKSALCSAVLGELFKGSGQVEVGGDMAYVAQTAWIQNATLRDNILFGMPYDAERYAAVIEACQLSHDIAIFDKGDLVEIGERGLNLSGGQKQRVSLARAAYSRASIVALDDPLSATDPAVAEQLFSGCVRDAMHGRTRLLVTHQVHVLSKCDGVAVLEKGTDGIGRIVKAGTFEALMQDPEFAGKVEQYKQAARDSHDDDEAGDEEGKQEDDGSRSEEEKEEDEGKKSDSADADASAVAVSLAASKEEGGVALVIPAAGGVQVRWRDGFKVAEPVGEEQQAAVRQAEEDRKARSAGFRAKMSQLSLKASSSADLKKAAKGVLTSKSGSVVRPSPGAAGKAPATAGSGTNQLGTSDQAGQQYGAEGREEGAVQLKYYIGYLQTSNCWMLMAFGLLTSTGLAQFASLANQWWIAFWSNTSEDGEYSLGFYMGILAALGVLQSVLNGGRLILFVWQGIAASRELHDKLYKTVLSAPMSVHDTVPSGRILSRFSKDLFDVDTKLGETLGMFTFMIFLVIGSLGAIVFATPWFGVAMVPILAVYFFAMSYFRNASREIKRTEGVSRGPIYAFFGETLGGLSTIRAFGKAQPFAMRNESLVANNISAWYTQRAIDRWLSIRLETMGNLIVAVSAVLAIVSAQYQSRGGIAGLAGFALTYSMSLTGILNWTTRMAAEVENQMNSAERIMGVTEQTPQEIDEEDPDLPASWPSKGEVAFKGYKMRYRDNTPEVLHGVNFSLKAGETCGVVGRTGSGKSSLLAALFRIVETKCKEGSIVIDGRDVDSMGLGQLRRRLAIIPQEPTLFIGTVRDNLDPVREIREKLGDEGAEEAMWKALRRVKLEDEIKKRWTEFLSKDLEGTFELPSGFDVDALVEARDKFDRDATIAAARLSKGGAAGGASAAASVTSPSVRRLLHDRFHRRFDAVSSLEAKLFVNARSEEAAAAEAGGSYQHKVLELEGAGMGPVQARAQARLRLGLVDMDEASEAAGLEPLDLEKVAADARPNGKADSVAEAVAVGQAVAQRKAEIAAVAEQAAAGFVASGAAASVEEAYRAMVASGAAGGWSSCLRFGDLDVEEYREQREELLKEKGDRALDAPVSESGENFSVGQRALICLCRVLLRADDVRVLCLDEASASLDQEADALVHQVVSEDFKQATILTIAHRLHTVIGSDKILVMDDGVVGEFGHPWELLREDGPEEEAQQQGVLSQGAAGGHDAQEEEGGAGSSAGGKQRERIFASMVDATGDAAEGLRNRARTNYVALRAQ